MANREAPLVFASVRDAQALAAMSRDLIEAGLGWDYRRERIARMIADADTVTLVARDGLRISGFAAMTFGDERAHLVLLAVRPSHQRRGIARRLVDWLVESAMTAGVASIHVELRASNVRGVRVLPCDRLCGNVAGSGLLPRTRSGSANDPHAACTGLRHPALAAADARLPITAASQ